MFSKLKVLTSITALGVLAACGQTQSSSSGSELDGVHAGRQLSRAQVRQLVVDAGFRGWEVDVAVCIAWEESKNMVASYNMNSDGTYDEGLFQINSLHHRLCGITHYSQLDDPVTNVRCARKVYNERRGFDYDGFNAWATYGYCR